MTISEARGCIAQLIEFFGDAPVIDVIIILNSKGVLE